MAVGCPTDEGRLSCVTPTEKTAESNKDKTTVWFISFTKYIVFHSDVFSNPPEHPHGTHRCERLTTRQVQGGQGATAELHGQRGLLAARRFRFGVLECLFERGTIP